VDGSDSTSDRTVTLGDSMGSIPRMDPAIAREHFDRIGRFRVLVIGRSNAGKTTLLQRICNTTELPEVFNSDGDEVWLYHLTL